MNNNIFFENDNLLSKNFNNKSYGISSDEILKIQPNMEKCFEDVMINRQKEATAYFSLVESPKDIEEIENYANQIAENFENFVVLGIGGSALGARALISGLKGFEYNYNEKIRKFRPKVFIEDSIDPTNFLELMDSIDVSKTMFCVISKSGGTLETTIQLSVAKQKLKQVLGDDFAGNFCVITSLKDGKLNKWAQHYNIKTFYFDNSLSGRFSVLSAVGLLPAAVCGIDIRKIISGGKAMLERCESCSLQNPALYGATMQKIAMDKGVNISFVMPYADNLKVLVEWYCQIWAESLGKTKVENGRTIRVGQTPVRANGTVDQHSQLQLCLEGPFDKLITFIRVNNFKKDIIIPSTDFEIMPENVAGKKLSQILNASQISTAKALLDCGRLNRTIVLDEINEYSMGELLMFFMVETSFMAGYLKINCYNQPSVELIKQNIKLLLKEKK